MIKRKLTATVVEDGLLDCRMLMHLVSTPIL